MEQRTLRLGDTVDDYCPRERRITNHVVVAIVVDAIRQTRCSTCDAEHPYKDGREPRRRLVTGRPAPADPAAAAPREVHAQAAPQSEPHEAPPVPMRAVASAPVPVPPPAPPMANEPTDAWVSHRRLIRASLPKTEGELPPPRAIPEFTMHQRPPSRRDSFRPWQNRGQGGAPHQSRGHNNGNGEANGNVAPGAGRPARPHGRPSQGEPAGDAPGGGDSRRHRGGKSRRSR